MDYNENEFKEKANRKARRIWFVFAILLSANYGSDVSKGLKLLHDKGSEAMKAVESILIESQHKTKEIYMNFEK